MIHRDIKPENILLSAEHALVADFGVAKAVDLAHEAGAGSRATGTGYVIGTMAYMAPEQAVADPAADHRIDLYALGLVGYELLAGKVPFAGHNPRAMLAARLSESPASVTALRPDCPADLAELLDRLLERSRTAGPHRGTT